ncbi:MAG: peptide ABC transporter substrate-binding protein [Verrucomicrobiae bacterium]|nr:peptide ABC transporter substrate-binding protein [Verrucomicrobiae bacterium]
MVARKTGIHRLVGTAFGAVALALMASGCGGPTPVEKATAEKTLLLGNASEPQGLDPHLVSGVIESNIIRALFEGLCVEHPSENGTPLPGVAESWEANEKFTEWTFHLRENAQWSDGHPLTAEDFLFSFQRILNPRLGSEYSFMLYYIIGAEDLHQSRRTKAVAKDHPDLPVAWEVIEKDVNLSGDESAEEGTFAQKGLDHLNTEELRSVKADLSLFPWPDSVPENARAFLVDQLIAFDESGESLWDKIGVAATAPDPHTLHVKLRAPMPFLPELTKHYTWFPVPEHAILARGAVDDRFSDWTQPGNLVSNGAFTLKSWRINDHIEIVKNPRYWDAETVQLNAVRYFPITNVYSEARMFYNDQLHITYTLGPELIRYSEENYPQQTRNELYLGTYFIRCNVTRKPLTDVRVRKALSMAIDQQSIIDNVLQGGQKPARGLVPPSGEYESPDLVRFDPEEARRLLAEAGFPNGEGFPDIRFLTTDRESAKRGAEALQGMWKEHLNISVGIDQMEWATYLSTMFKMEYDLAAGGWIGDYLDPTTFLDMWMKDGGNNRTGWFSKEYEAILREAEQIADPLARNQRLQDAERLFLEERPVLPLYWYTRNYLVHQDVKGWYPLLLDNHPLKFVRLEP